TTSFEDDLFLTIIISSSGFFGPDQTVCENIDHINLPCEVGSGFWADYDLTYGDGYFDGYAPWDCPWSLDYFPGPGDQETGYVEFCLTLYYDDFPYFESDCIIYYFQNLPSVNAGEDITINANENAVLNASAENHSSFIWSTSGDGSFEDILILSTTYFPGPQDIISGQVEICLTAHPTEPCIGNVMDCLIVTILENTCQNFNLQNGWSGISINLIPENPSIEDILFGLEDNLVILYSTDGIYYPQGGINTIVQWDNNTGYVIKLENSTDFSVCGTQLETKTLTLEPGWHYLPVLSTIPVSCSYLFASVIDNIIIVKEIAGTKMFWPNAGIYSLDNLEPGKSYLIKLNSQVNITFPNNNQLANVTTADITDINPNSAIGGGNVIDNGGNLVTDRGVCWSTSPNPDVFDNKTTNGSGTGSFISYLTNLDPNTTYYVRAFATNLPGTAYGDQKQFTTLNVENGQPCPGIETINYGGQTYNTVLIGDQCWLKENLNIGSMIPGEDEMQNNGTIEKYCYDNNPSNCDIYGGLYQWDEMMQYTTLEGVKGICPAGWHIPTDDEWKTLEGNVDSLYPVGDPQWDNTDWRGYDCGKNLKSTNTWFDSGNGTDIYGYTILPSGLYSCWSHNFEGITQYLGYWTSSEISGSFAISRTLGYNKDNISRNTYNSAKKWDGFSVRCLKN
nr:hypothetical protein [Bacteroidota bacterium]